MEFEINKYNRILIDEEDYQKVNAHKWNMSPNGHITTTLNGFVTSLTQFLCNHYYVIFKNKNYKDYRKDNLIITNKDKYHSFHKQNPYKQVDQRSVRTKITGLYSRPNGKWSGRVSVKGKRIHVGTYDNKMLAIRAIMEYKQNI